jgi:hypothetical protein
MPTVTRDADYWADIRNGHVSPAPRPVQDALGTYIEFSDMGRWHGMIDNSKNRSGWSAAGSRQPLGATPRRWQSLATPAHRSEARRVDLRTDDEVLATNQDYPVCSGPSANTSAAKESC